MRARRMRKRKLAWRGRAANHGRKPKLGKRISRFKNQRFKSR